MINCFLQKVIADPEKVLNELIRDAVREELSKSNIPLTQAKIDSPEYLTRKEAATFLKISLTQLYYLQKKGIVRFYRLGKKVYFAKQDLQNSLVSSQKGKGGCHGEK